MAELKIFVKTGLSNYRLCFEKFLKFQQFLKARVSSLVSGREHRSRTLLNLLEVFFIRPLFENILPALFPFLHVFILARPLILRYIPRLLSRN